MPTAALTVWEDFEVPAHARGGQVTLNLHDHLAAYAPKRPGAYLRISSDRFGFEAGVDRQLEGAEDSRARLRWGACLLQMGQRAIRRQLSRQPGNSGALD